MKYLKLLLLVLVLSGCAYPPPVGPGPGPKPDPVPDVVKVHSVYAITVADPDVLTTDQANFIGDLDYWQKFDRRGHLHRHVTVDDPEAAKYSRQISDAKGTPCVILLDPSKSPAQVLAAVSLPVDGNAMDTLTAQYSDK